MTLDDTTRLKVERCIFNGERYAKFNPVCDKEYEKEIIELFLDGDYEKVLKCCVARQLLCDADRNEVLGLTETIQKNIKSFLSSSGDACIAQRELEVLTVGVSCLQLFVQDNWLGPPTRSHPTEFLPESYKHEDKKFFKMALLAPQFVLASYFISASRFWTVISVLLMWFLNVDHLSKNGPEECWNVVFGVWFTLRQQLFLDVEKEMSVDGEPVYNLTKNLEYLYLAKKILTQREHFHHLQTADLWLMRCLNINQQILDNQSPTLKTLVMSLIDEISKLEPLMTDDKNKDIILQFHLEAGYLCYTYYQYKEAHDHFITARKASNLCVELSGAMGKRTRFQKEEKAQLVLSVQRHNHDKASVLDKTVAVAQTSELPKDLELDDDTILNAIQFDEIDRKFSVDLLPLEQAVILGIMEDHRRSQASQEKITEEEIMAYLHCVLSHVKTWSVAVSALYLRSKLEKGSRRRVERSMMQLEEIVNQTRRPLPPAAHRLKFFYCVNNSPLWIVQKQLAELFLSLGSIGAAVEVFERLQLWEEVISCYKRLGKMEKAETLIREQLAIKETPNLWCFLGDVTSHIEFYEKAWELSNQKSARAQRCMGYIYMSKEMYVECLSCFEKSLKVNSLQIPVWFTYGCAAMTAGEDKLAVKAFKHCVSIDSDNFEAWTNMATSYVRLKEKEKAFRILEEALKCNYENWRIWENYIVVAMDCGRFDDVIRSYHRLMDLKDKWMDVEVLEILVRVMIENILDANGKPGTLLKPKLRELFGKITASVTTNGGIWRLYAEVCSVDGVENPENRDKILQYLQKAHRCVMQESNWEKEVERCKEVGIYATELVKAYISCYEKAENSNQAIPLLSSAKLMLKGVLTKIKQKHIDDVSQELVADLRETCDSLEEELAGIVNRLTELKVS